MQRFVERAQRLVLARKNPWLAAGLIVLGVAMATYLRYIVDRGTSGFLFSGYFPIILLAAMMCGWRLALLAVFTTVLAIKVVFWPEVWILSGSLGPPAVLFAFLATVSLVLAITELLRTMIFRYEAQAADFAARNAELIHRNKNALQVLMAVIQRGLREPDLHTYFEALPSRVGAWAKASELLRFGALPNCDLAELVNLALGPFNLDRFQVDGPSVVVSEKSATALSMILHELGTNAAKYGALSVDAGSIKVIWRAKDGGVEIIWEEGGGPPVEPPGHRGFGSMILRPQADLETVQVDYAPSGVVATMRIRTDA